MRKLNRIVAPLLIAAIPLATLQAAAGGDKEKAEMNVTDTAETLSPDNALLAEWPGPFGGVPQWDEVDVADFPAAFRAAMDAYVAERDAILSDPAPATFANTIVPLEKSGRQLERLFSIWGVYSSNLSNDAVQAIEAEWEPKLWALMSELKLDPRYFARVKAIYDDRDNRDLDAEQMRVVTRTYEELVREGAELGEEQKDRLVEISGELAGKFAEFSKRVLDDEETYILLADEADLAGLPDSFVASLKSAAEERGLGGWAVVNTRSVMQPFLENSTRRDLREKVWHAYVMRGDNGDQNDTKQVIADILALRQERAKLLGFDSHADFRMADTMAKTPKAAMELMMKVWPAAKARVAEEVAAMQAIADAEGAGITIEPWDYRFYMEKLRKAQYDLDSAELKPYFQLDKMMEAMFDEAHRLYGLTFTENTGAVPVFHPDVRTFAVTRAGKTVGLFYLDNYARAGKRSGAWMTTYRSQSHLTGDDIVLASNNNNFVKPAPGEATLISLDDATTLFHEFGHTLHYLNYDITYPSLGETPRDYVEFPSQVNEKWLMTPYILQNYAVHYKTGEPIPQALVDKVKASETFMEGFYTVEFLASAILDMKLHDRSEPVTDVAAFEKQALAEIGMPKEIAMRHRLPQFNHLFSSDAYSAGYYSYLWSEVMVADAWEAFEEAGVWDKETAERFRREILASGNSYDRAEAYRNFRGRDPDVSALFRARGFPMVEEAGASEAAE